MSSIQRGESPHGPRTLRERIAYALAAHDTYGNTRYTSLSDGQLAELSDFVTFAHSPTGHRYRLATQESRVLVSREREARGWDHEKGILHINWRDELVEDTWREWLPMADAVLTALMVIPDVAQVVTRDLAHPTEYPDDPDPIPPAPPPHPAVKGGPNKPPPTKRAKKPKAA